MGVGWGGGFDYLITVNFQNKAQVQINVQFNAWSDAI